MNFCSEKPIFKNINNFNEKTRATTPKYVRVPAPTSHKDFITDKKFALYEELAMGGMGQCIMIMFLI